MQTKLNFLGIKEPPSIEVLKKWDIKLISEEPFIIEGEKDDIINFIMDYFDLDSENEIDYIIK